MRSKSHTRSLAFATCAAVAAILCGRAEADGQREGLAHVIVEGVTIGFKHVGGKVLKWDNGGEIDAGQVTELTAAASQVAITAHDARVVAWTKLADVVARMWATSKSKTDPPDPRGVVTMTVGTRAKPPIVLPIARDTYTPDWSAQLQWSSVPLNEDVRIRIQLWDSDDAKKPDRDDKIGTIVLTSDDLKQALRDGHVYSIYTGTQANDQIIAVKVTVMLDVYASANSLEANDGRADASDNTTSMKPYQHGKGKLEILMPGTPKEDNSVEKTAVGDITLWQASVVLTTKAYFVSYSDMPKATWKGDPKQMLEGARDGAAGRVKGRIVADREISIGKWPGREFKIVVDKMELTQRVYLVDHRLYQVNMGCLSGICSDSEVQDYLNSFKVVGVQ